MGQNRHSRISRKQHLRGSSCLASTRTSMHISCDRTRLILLQNTTYPCQWLDWRERGSDFGQAALDDFRRRKADLSSMLGSYSSITEQERMSGTARTASLWRLFDCFSLLNALPALGDNPELCFTKTQYMGFHFESNRQISYL